MDMKYLGINAAAAELRVHESSLRRWEEWDLIFPERVDMGNIRVRIYDEFDMEVMRHAKNLMNSGMDLRDAFEQAYSEITLEDTDHD
jgi:MerR family transcriptional regulator, heat shock protein HspR